MRYGFVLVALMGCVANGGDDGVVREGDLKGVVRMSDEQAAKAFVTVDGKTMSLAELAPGERYYEGAHVDERPGMSLTLPPPPAPSCETTLLYSNVPDTHVTWHCTIDDCTRVYTTYYVAVECDNHLCNGGSSFTCVVTSGCPTPGHSIAQPTSNPTGCFRSGCNLLNVCNGC